ncbi:hypothetical protein [Pseudomonas gingeri]|uniref:Ig-like domain repeat protein n=1 Tax=Pseudomonas gingeri TaxID=117681 RepID=A0A7Y7XZ84_9PSED|nr:hypothetical protein [Pseudomonas gingeri]NWA05062.1 hypothetical protein [Pseudomonas gingeri]NWA16345.1 hypothetical protein [Pseudomonas gingeri]NWA54771.1 hypothetical protein [Pseudomonas gingeri]NWA99160.1 hypothetical protein [Pseudomonas gingeri]NWB05572.1 hypothetical protein [Pseudomonas gingeri]
MNDYVDPLLPSHDPSQDDAPSQARTFDLSRPEPITPVPFNELDLYIPNMTAPVVGFDGGINRAALDAHRDKGLQCILLPYRGIAENDFIELFCRDTVTPVAFHTVSDIEAANNAQISLFIPRARLPDGPADPVFFHLTRVSGNDDETDSFRLKVDTVAPGGRNPVASTYYNENLAMPGFPQDLIDFGVGEGDIGTPVPVRIDFYPAVSNPATDINRSVRDRIRLSIGGYIVEHKVTEGEAETQEPITLQINTGDWAKIGSGEHVCEYEVVDEVGNYSDGWSPAQLLEVRLDDQAEPLLYEPYVEESDEHNELDADALDGADATVVVAVHRADFAVGDTIRLRLNGRTSTGLPVVRHIDHPVAANELGRTARIPWDNADIRSLIKGRVQISYIRIRPSAPDRNSRSVIVYVTGTQAGTGLPPPTVEGAPGDVLPPDIAFLIVNIKEYLGQDPFDRITLVLDGTFANGQSYYDELYDIAGEGDIVFRLQNGPNGDIARLEGGTLRLYYWVENAMGKIPSEDLLLDVGEPQASLPPVEVNEAPPPDQVFDPEVSLFDARVLVKANVDIIENDIINLHAEGSAPGGSAPPFSFPVTAPWVGRDLPFTLKRQYILPNLDRSMRLYYTLARAGERIRFSHPFIMKVGSALDLPVPHILESTITGPDSATINPLHVDSPPVVTIRVQYSPMYASDNITVHWIGKPGIGTPDIEPKPGLTTGQVDFTAHSSAVAAAIGAGCEVSYSVERGGATTPSRTLHVSVDSFSDGDLPRPEFYADNVLVTGATLDVTKAIKVRAPSWPLIAAGQKVWLRLTGQPNSHTLWEATTVSPTWVSDGHGEIPVPASYLNGLDHASSLSTSFKVTFDHSSVEANATTFPSRLVTVQNLPSVIIIPQITSIKDASGNDIANGTNVITTTVTLTGRANDGGLVEIRDGNNVMRTVTANASGVWTTTPALTVTTKDYSITARGLYGNNPESAPPRTFKVIKVYYETFETVPLQKITAGQSIDTSLMVILLRPGSTGESEIVDYRGNQVPDMQSGHSIALSRGNSGVQRLRLTFKRGYVRVRFAFTYLNLPAKVFFYNSIGALLAERDFAGGDGGTQVRHHWVDYSAPSINGPVAYIEVTSNNDYTLLDFFTLWG